MMKKLAMVCVLVLVAGSAFAAPYTWNVEGSDANGGNAAGQVRLGVQTAVAAPVEQDYGVTNAAIAAVVGDGSWLTTPTVAKPNLYATYKVQADPSKYILQLNGAADWASGDVWIRIWASSSASSKPVGKWTLSKLYDPISDTWGRTQLGTIDCATITTAGSLANPWFKTSLPSYKTAAPYGAKNGYILELSVPEPGSMVAMLSGLVGLIGFGIRRRK